MIIVSACLVGHKCRYDGKAKENQDLQEFLKDKEFLAVCPEQLGDLPTPRDPAEENREKIITINGKDVTLNYELGANRALEIATKSQCDFAILKGKSPMCGKDRIYDGTYSSTLKEGNGVFTKKLIENDIPVFNSDDKETQDLFKMKDLPARKE